MTWGNPRWQRMLTWALRWRSWALGRVPTFREAWTGEARSTVWTEIGGAMADGFAAGEAAEKGHPYRGRRP
jgi:hypothetical protein